MIDRETPIDMDIPLVERVKAGDRNAFAGIVRKYQRHVLNIVYRFTGDSGEAEDVASEIFFKVWKGMAAFEGKSRFSTWLYRIAVNHCLNERRKRRTDGRTIPLDEAAEKNMPPVAEAAKDGGETHERRVAGELMFKAMESLPESQRMALILVKIQGNSYAETAEIMRLSVSAVESLIFRGMKSLRERVFAAEAKEGL